MIILGKTKQEWQELLLQYRPEWIIFLIGFILGAIIFQMHKQLTQQQNLKELSSERRILQLMRLTLINILNAKGVIYTYYKQQKERENNGRQSNI